MDSLSGQNMRGRPAGVGSSPAPSTLSTKEKTRLWKRLRKLDREISLIPRYLLFEEWPYPDQRNEARGRFKRFDEQRKQARLRLKQTKK